jgi:hypothetical protein
LVLKRASDLGIKNNLDKIQQAASDFENLKTTVNSKFDSLGSTVDYNEKQTTHKLKLYFKTLDCQRWTAEEFKKYDEAIQTKVNSEFERISKKLHAIEQDNLLVPGLIGGKEGKYANLKDYLISRQSERSEEEKALAFSCNQYANKQIAKAESNIFDVFNTVKQSLNLSVSDLTVTFENF